MRLARIPSLLLLLLSVAGPGCSHALSRNTADSLTSKLGSGPADTVRVAILLQLSELFRYDSLIASFGYAHQAERLARRHGWTNARIDAEIAIGACLDEVQQWDQALRRYHSARQLALAHQLDALLLRSEIHISETFNSAGERDNTLRYKLLALDHARRSRDSLAEARLLTYLGGYYKDLGHAAEALKYWHAAVAVTLKMPRPAAQAMALNNLGDSYLEMRMTDSAGIALREALRIVRTTNNPRTESYILASLGSYYEQADQPRMAIESSNAALGLALLPDGDRRVAEAVLEQLSNYYAQAGRNTEALNYFKRYIVQRDSNRNEARKAEDARAVAKYNFELETAASEAERQNLRATSRVQLNALIAAGIGLFIITILAVYAYFSLRQNKRKAHTISSQARQLQEQNEAIQESLREKEMLIREVHHRVKNNLQVISALLQLQGSRSVDPLVKMSLEESQNRMLSIAFIHHNLYMHDDIQEVEMQSFLSELVQHLSSVYTGPDREVRVLQDVETVSLDMDVAMPLGLIINELLTNSYKYAFPGRADGTITIALGCPDENTCLLEYSDDGPGLPGNTDTANAKTLGLTLVNDLCRQLGGTAQIQSAEGFRFELLFRSMPDEDDT